MGQLVLVLLASLLSVTRGQQTPCASAPCANGGLCVEDGRTTFVCQCARGFGGVLCDAVLAPPMAVLSAPSVVGPCDALFLDASASVVPANSSAPPTFLWFLDGVPFEPSPYPGAKVFAAHFFPPSPAPDPTPGRRGTRANEAGSVLAFHPLELDAGRSYTFAVRVLNAFNQSSVLESRVVSRSALAVPTLGVTQTPALVSAESEVRLSPVVSASRCAPFNAYV